MKDKDCSDSVNIPSKEIMTKQLNQNIKKFHKNFEAFIDLCEKGDLKY